MDGENMRERRMDEDGDQHSNYNRQMTTTLVLETVPHSRIKP